MFEPLGGQGSSGHMEDGGGELAGDLYIFGIISKSPCEAVKVVVRAPVVREP